MTEFALDPDRPDLGGNIQHGDMATHCPILWRYLVERFAVGSVLDVGCGEGHAVAFFRRLGCIAHGIDGLHVNVMRAVTPIALHDLTKAAFVMPVDMVWSCEVAEHLPDQTIDYFLDTLANGRVVALTHALPGQEGYHHINCQPQEYWIDHMAARGFTLDRQYEDYRAIARSEPVFNYFSLSGLIFQRQSSAQSLVRKKPERTQKYEYAIVLPVRWETECILEWIAYHRSIGFEHIYLYCNDDDPTELFDRLAPCLSAPSPFVTFLHYPFQGLQWNIYLHWFRNFSHETVWCSFIDADEFLVLPGLDNIAAFMRRFPATCDVVYFYWIYYGTSGFVDRPQGSVLRQYTRRAGHVSNTAKSMIRVSQIEYERLNPNQTAFWHLWDASHGQNLRCFTSLGETASGWIGREIFGEDRSDEIRQTAYMAHFAIKSETDFHRRVARGTGGTFSGQVTWADHVQTGWSRSYIDMTNEEEDLYLKQYWERVVGTPVSKLIIPAPPSTNLAVGCPATQSSTCEWSTHSDPEQEAAGAVSGTVTGRPSFHTAQEQSPWWQVDLGERREVCEIRVYNRVDDMGVAARCNPLILLASDDGEGWTEIHRRVEDFPFGGADGSPLIWKAPRPVGMRYVRVTVPAFIHLSLDQVEVYG